MRNPLNSRYNKKSSVKPYLLNAKRRFLYKIKLSKKNIRSIKKRDTRWLRLLSLKNFPKSVYIW